MGRDERMSGHHILRTVIFFGVLFMFGLWGQPWSSGALGHDTNLTGVALPSENRGPFSLVDHTGRTVTNDDFLGTFMLVYFGYTNCIDVCPLDLQTIGDAIDLLGDDGDKVRPVFITVDPWRDTVTVMADYVSHFHPRIIGLTGDPEQVAGALAVYRVRARKFFPLERMKAVRQRTVMNQNPDLATSSHIRHRSI